MKKKKVFSIIVILLFVYGCGELFVEPDLKDINGYGVVFILYSWSNYQSGYITKTDVPKSYGGGISDSKNFIDSAVVLIDEIQFKNISKDSILTSWQKRKSGHMVNYYIDSLKLISGNTYNLKISISEEHILNGSTKVPSKIKFEKITNDEKYYYVYWKDMDSVMYDWSLRDTHEILGTKSSFVNFAKIKKEFVQKEKEYELRVYTFDKNLTKYYHEEMERSGIDNQYGVFGSVTRKILKLKF